MRNVGEERQSYANDEDILRDLNEFLGNKRDPYKKKKKEVVKIYQNTSANLAMGWVIYDDNQEICMMSDGVLDQFALKSKSRWDWTQDMSRERRYMAFPRTGAIFREQWKNCIAQNRPNVVVLDDGGVSIVSTMYPQNWKHPDNMSGLGEATIVRQGTSKKLGKEGLTKCICHSWTRHLMGTLANTDGYELVGRVEVNAET